jgi:plasmid stabilization system protein ParE
MAYFVHLTETAKQDIEHVIDYIEHELLAPLAAENFLRGIYGQIAALGNHAGIFAISAYRDVLAYGRNARHVTYGGFAIIYTIHGSVVVVHRIAHGSLIRE